MSKISFSPFANSDLPSLARHLLEDGPRKLFPANRRVRVLFNHTFIVDTTAALHVWEHDAYPQFYIPTTELKHCNVSTVAPVKTASGAVGASILSLKVPAAKGSVNPKVTDRVIAFQDEKVAGPLAGLCRLEFRSMDQWFEEETPIYVHPKDPFKRIEILPSTRKIVVKLEGVTLASTNYAMHLHETGLPTRYYLPYTSVDVTKLRKSDLITKCPYKGDAEYFHIDIDGQQTNNLIWWYRLPTAESAQVAGLLCFYNEKVDIEVDGVLQERPKTHFT